MKKTVATLLTILMLFSLFQGVLRENVAKADETDKWVPINKGLYGGTVHSIAVDSKNTNVIYAGTEQSVFKSINGGKNWSKTGLITATIYSLGFDPVYSLAIDPTNAQAVYAGTRDGIFESIDGGTSWTQVGLAGLGIYSLAIDSTNSNVIYAGTASNKLGSTDGGIFKSTNGGANWLRTGIVNVGIGSIIIDPRNTRVIYTGIYGSGVFKSIDGGTSWTQVNNKLTSKNVTSLVIDPKNTNVIYAGTRNSVFKSIDGGKNWTQSGLKNEIVHSFVIDQKNTQVIYAGTDDDGIFKSTNNGKNWTQINNGLTDKYVNCLAIDPKNNQVIYAGTDDGIIFKLVSNTVSKTVIILRIGKSTFTVNGASSTLDSPPVIKNNRTLLPIRAIIEALGGTVSWNATEKKVTVTLGSKTIELWTGKNIAKINSVDTPIDSTNSKVVPEIINGRTMLPLRFVTEKLGCDVQWEQSTQTITIKYGE